MCAIMHEAEPYGHLLVNGQPVTDTQLALMVGCLPDQLTELLGELDNAGVFSRNGKGVIYSRRMTRDEKRAKISRKNGKAGGNPKLSNQRENSSWVNLKDKPPDKAQKPEARSQIKEIPAKAGSKKKSQLPENWMLPDDWIEPAEAHARGKGFLNTFDWQEQGVKFHAYHRSKGNLMLDWSAAWRTWYINAVKYEVSNGKPSHGTNQGQRGSIAAAVGRAVAARNA